MERTSPARESNDNCVIKARDLIARASWVDAEAVEAEGSRSRARKALMLKIDAKGPSAQPGIGRLFSKRWVTHYGVAFRCAGKRILMNLRPPTSGVEIAVLALALFLCVVPTRMTVNVADAVIRQVSTTGVDNADCVSPCRHIQFALSKAVAGDTVLVESGTYQENIALSSGVHLLSNQGATIQGDGITHVVDVFQTGSGTIVEGFVITGGNIGILVFNASVEIRRNVIVNNLNGSQAGGIFLSNCSAVIVSNNLIRGNTTVANGGAIEIEMCAGPVSIINNTIDGNSSSNASATGQAIGVVGSNVLVQNNIVSNHSTFPKTAIDADSGGALLKNNLFFNNAGLYTNGGTIVSTIAALNALPSNAGNIEADPLYANAASGNFHLQSGSPAINFGLLTGAPSVDFDGDVRPFGGAVDIGFDETTFGVNPPPAITGCVQIDGAPLVGTAVTLQQQKGSKRTVTAVTSAAGCYSFETPTSGRSGTITIDLPVLP